MKVLALVLAAAVPLMAPWDDERLPPLPLRCHVGIDLQLRAALPWGPLEWTVFRSQVDRFGEQFGVTVTWTGRNHPCGGLRVRLRVVVEDDALTVAAGPRAAIPMEWNWSIGRAPLPEIHLSLSGAETVVERARIGSGGAWTSTSGICVSLWRSHHSAA